MPKFCGDKIFSYIWQDKALWVELKTNRGVIFITMLPHLYYFISLETANSQKSEVFLLRIYLGNGNASVASVVTSWYPQIYNFSFRKEFLETLCKCIYKAKCLLSPLQGMGELCHKKALHGGRNFVGQFLGGMFCRGTNDQTMEGGVNG